MNLLKKTHNNYFTSILEKYSTILFYYNVKIVYPFFSSLKKN